MPLARSVRTVIDCSDPGRLAAFYSAVLGWDARVNADNSWAGVWSDGDAQSIRFQRVDDFRRPTWPESTVPQQMHLDFHVDDLDDAESKVLAVDPAATKAAFQPGETFRVFLDPAGHPFCLTLTT